MTLVETREIEVVLPGAADKAPWIDVCALSDLDRDRGVRALVAGEPVALFRCSPFDELFAISDVDPYSSASVLSRGIVGSIGDRPVVSSPMYKNRFDLVSGRSLDDASIGVDCWDITRHGDRVLVRAAPRRVPERETHSGETAR